VIFSDSLSVLISIKNKKSDIIIRTLFYDFMIFFKQNQSNYIGFKVM
jgi:hypothetical protein